MANCIAINNDISVGDQPTENDLKELAKNGFRTVISLCPEDAPEQPISPDDEGRHVKALGMRYVHIPVTLPEIKLQQIDRFNHELLHLPEPAFIHCGTGRCATAFAIMHVAVEQGWSEDQAFETARQLGVEFTEPAVREFIKGYLRSRKEAP